MFYLHIYSYFKLNFFYRDYDETQPSSYMQKHQKANDLCERMKSQRIRNRPDAQEVLDLRREWALFPEDFDLETELSKISAFDAITQTYFFTLLKRKFFPNRLK
jgi:hypothetical protein